MKNHRNKSKINTGWRIRTARSEDCKSIVKLLNSVYGDWGDTSLWRWKYENNSVTHPTCSRVAELDGRLIGHFGVLPVRVVLNGQIVMGAQAVDAAVVPEYRRQGVHSSLGRLALTMAIETNIEFIYAFPGLFSIGVDRRFGFEPVMYLPEMTCLLHIRRLITGVLRHLPGDALALWRWKRDNDLSPSLITSLVQMRESLLLGVSWMSSPTRIRKILPDSDKPEPKRFLFSKFLQKKQGVHRLGLNNIDVRRIQTIDGRFNTFMHQRQLQQKTGVLKDSAYLKWRYQNHPTNTYLILSASYQGEIVGYTIMRNDGTKSVICELEVLPDIDGAVVKLLDAAIEIARSSGSLTLTIWMPDWSPYHNKLRQVGFISQHHLHQLAHRWSKLSDQLYQIILYTGHNEGKKKQELLRSTVNWSPSLGDSDLV